MKKLLFILPVLFFALSCDNDDDDDTPSGSTKTQIISQTAWKFENIGLDMDKNGTMDLDQSNVIPACVKDNTLKFEANGTGIVNEGAAMCQNSPGQTAPFTWAFVSNETALNISGNAVLGYGGQYKIVTLTDTRLSLSKDTTLPLVGNQTLIANFIH